MPEPMTPQPVCIYAPPGAHIGPEERAAIESFGRFLADHKAINEQYDGDERETRLAELVAAYEAEHCRRVR